MRKIYHLATCTTCQRILKELKPGKEVILQDIKTEPITPQQLDEMKKMAGNYEALFSRVALKYRSMGLNTMTLAEKDFRKYILMEYTFLRRPVMIFDDQIFIGNAPKVIDAAKKYLKTKNPDYSGLFNRGVFLYPALVSAAFCFISASVYSFI